MDIEPTTTTTSSTTTTTTTTTGLTDDQKITFHPIVQKQHLVERLESRIGCPLLGPKTGFVYGPIERKVKKAASWEKGCEPNETEEENAAAATAPINWKYTKADELELIECWSLDGIKHSIPKALLIQRSDYFAKMEQDHPQLFSQLCQSDTGLTLFTTGEVTRRFVEVLLYGFLMKLHSNASLEEKSMYMQLVSSLAHYRVTYLPVNGSASVFSDGCVTSTEYTK